MKSSTTFLIIAGASAFALSASAAAPELLNPADRASSPAVGVVHPPEMAPVGTSGAPALWFAHPALQGPSYFWDDVCEAFDTNHDHKLSREERAAMRAAFAQVAAELRKRALARYDADGDGHLNAEERFKMRQDLQAAESQR